MIRKVNTTNIIFFSVLLLLSVTVLPAYALRVGFSPAEWWLFFGFATATGAAITVGYHRLFAHRAFQASRIITFLAVFFGAAAFEQSALMWASQHRDHHRFVDTDRDPYSIKKGFWYAHIGWLLFYTHETDYSNVQDLAADPLIAHQHKYYLWWAIGTGVLLPLAIGAASGHLLGALLLGVIGRLTFVHHSTFCINSVCHTFGRATYDIDATARDHWLVALITVGEGYHNFHHRFASDYRNGVRWYHWDPSKWLIAMLSWCGLARNLYRAPRYAILAAKTAAEHTRVERTLKRRRPQETAGLLAAVQERYESFKSTLYEWERWEKELRRLRTAASATSRKSLRSLRHEVASRRLACAEARRAWVRLIRSSPLIARTAQI